MVPQAWRVPKLGVAKEHSQQPRKRAAAAPTAAGARGNPAREAVLRKLAAAPRKPARGLGPLTLT